MTNLNQIYKCNVCGNIVEMVHPGAGALVCCDEDMKLFSENTVEASKEKHIPVVEKTGSGLLVKVGSIAHPMEDKHYIEWIEVLADNLVYRKNLGPGEEPKAEFPVKSAKITVRAYCNLHGLWKA
ncbi:MAG: desulfoferrodoxin [Elusimicrobia bacterium]|nr:desulfoferrodoxin [Candidatus Obscuribacterium magneticum]